IETARGGVSVYLLQVTGNITELNLRRRERTSDDKDVWSRWNRTSRRGFKRAKIVIETTTGRRVDVSMDGKFITTGMYKVIIILDKARNQIMGQTIETYTLIGMNGAKHFCTTAKAHISI